ncbi:MAG TPA: hypothetical protein PLK30_16410 [Blastocatellia bacterium]|nr:hypothetical protein [Blastocatellia bacterium]
MNCQEFDQIVSELATSRIMDAALLESGLTHAAACQNCASRLANTRALFSGLKALASTTEASEAPVQTEAVLLAAFRQQQSATTPTNQPEVVALLTRNNWLNRLPIWTYAAAATVLIGITSYSMSIWRSAQSAPTELRATTATLGNLSHRIEPLEGGLLLPVKQGDKPNFKFRKVRALQFTIAPVDDGSSVQASLGEFTPLLGEEIATDFLPLTHESDSQPMESGQVIRVQVPRTALASFGLPVNIERVNETVKADLLLAEDGSARAIRFVR